jgi:hypothetical protein
MAQAESKFRDPESKNRMKQVKADAQKQIERNKIILKDLINKYSILQSDPSRRGPSVVPTITTTTARTTCWAGA